MKSKFVRVLVTVVSVLVVIAIVLGAAGVYLTRSSFPQTNGQIKLSELDSAVDIYRDSYGIPNIYAQTIHDLFLLRVMCMPRTVFGRWIFGAILDQAGCRKCLVNLRWVPTLSCERWVGRGLPS